MENTETGIEFQFTNKRDERLVNSCMKEMDRIGMREIVRPQEGGKHEVSIIKRAVSMKVVVEDGMRCNLVAKRLKTTLNAFNSNLFKRAV